MVSTQGKQLPGEAAPLSRRSLMRTLAGSALATGAFALGGCGGGNGSSSAGATGTTGSAGTNELSPVTHEVANDEILHVRFLRGALGAAAVAKPALNLAALGPVTNAAQFLTVSRAFEDVGVSAYAGAAPLLTNKTYLQAAAQILGVEAYHAGNFRLMLVQQGISVTAIDAGDVPPTSTSFFTTGANALAVIRTPAQVLAVAGAFFPNGVNGTTNPMTDTEILNFALNLEYLEAEFYSWVTTGAGLTAPDTTGGGGQAPGATTKPPTFRT